MPVLNCICGHRIEGDDDAALFHLMRVHSDQVHADLRVTDAQIREVLALWSRMAPWDGRPGLLPGHRWLASEMYLAAGLHLTATGSRS